MWKTESSITKYNNSYFSYAHIASERNSHYDLYQQDYYRLLVLIQIIVLYRGYVFARIHSIQYFIL